MQKQIKEKRQIQQLSQLYADILKLVLLLRELNSPIAAKMAEKLRESQRMQFSLKELDWFSLNAYNSAVNGCENWESQQIVSITESCLKVLIF